jgi:phage terminase large subunit
LRWEKELQITCTLNPIDEEHWINQDFYIFWNTNDVEILHTTYKDNRFVWAEYEKVMERLKIQNPRMYEIYALWKWWRAVEWLIFNFIEIDKVPSEAKLVNRWLDFWFTNDPSAFTSIYEWNSWIILDEEFYRTWMTNQDIISMFKSIWIWKTDEIIADSSEPKSIEEIYRAWFNIIWAEKWPDSVIYWNQIMLQFTFYITKKSLNLKKEFKNYCRATDKEWKTINKPIDAFNHGIDWIRYAITKRYWTTWPTQPKAYFFN